MMADESDTMQATGTADDASINLPPQIPQQSRRKPRESMRLGAI